MGFSRQEDWRGLPCPPPGDLLNPGIEPAPPALAGGFFTTEPLGKPWGMTKQIGNEHTVHQIFPSVSAAKNSLAMQETQEMQENPLEEKMALQWHSNILAWEIPWTVWPRVIVQRAAKSGQG